ncbi:MAG: hypothetical protein VZR95_02325 [Alphaproteobacteria bacterium]
MDKLDELFAKVQQNDQQLRREQEKKLQEAQQRMQEAQQKMKEEELRKQQEARVRATLDIVKTNDVEKVKQDLRQGISFDFVNEDYQYGKAYVLRENVSSPEMAELVLDNIDLSNDNARNFATLMFANAINKEDAKVPELISLAKKHNLSLDPAMTEAKDIEIMEQLSRAGADIQLADFSESCRNFRRAKNGYRSGRDGEYWHDPNPEEAEKIKASLIPAMDRAAKLGYDFLQKNDDNSYKLINEYHVLASLVEDSSLYSLSSELRSQIKEVAGHEYDLAMQRKAEEEAALRAQEAEEAKKRQKEEIERQQYEKAVRKDRLNSDFKTAIEENDVDRAQALLAKGADISFINENPDKSYATRTVAEDVKSLEMVEFMCQQLDLRQDNHRRFAEIMVASAITSDKSPLDRIIDLSQKNIDKLIDFAQQHNISLEPAMQEASAHPETALLIYDKLTKAGVAPKAFDFSSLARRYYNKKDGYWESGRDDDYWREPQPEEAAELKKTLTEILKQGYPFDALAQNSAGYNFAKELTYEKRYNDMSDTDKKMIEYLQNDNIDAIHQTMKEGRLNDDVINYMAYVPTVQKKGNFFDHYQKMFAVYEKENKEPAETLEQAERYYTSHHNSFSNLCSVASFKPEGLSDNIGKAYVEECANLGCSELNLVQELPAEYRSAIGMHLASNVDEIIKNAGSSYTKKVNRLRILSECYGVCEGAGKEALRVSLLKYRTSGTNEERREKAELFERALDNSRLTKEERKDQTLKAVSRVSYTPLSSLNTQLRKHKKEMEK